MAHRGRTAIIPGENQPAAVHALCHAMNAALGNVGKTVIYTDPLEARPVDQVASLRQLVDDMDAGAVQVLLIIGGNPVYNSPADVNFTGAVAKVAVPIYLGLFPDETSRLMQWHIPESHFLESWGDARAFDGTVTILQPLIEPLYYSHSPLELLDLFFRNPTRAGHEIVGTTGRRMPTPPILKPGGVNPSGEGLIPGSGPAEYPLLLRPVTSTPRPCSNSRTLRASTSFFKPTRSSTTGAMPATHGCRNCRARSQSLPGTTRSTSAPARRSASVLKTSTGGDQIPRPLRQGLRLDLTGRSGRHRDGPPRLRPDECGRGGERGRFQCLPHPHLRHPLVRPRRGSAPHRQALPARHRPDA